MTDTQERIRREAAALVVGAIDAGKVAVMSKRQSPVWTNTLLVWTRTFNSWQDETEIVDCVAEMLRRGCAISFV